MRTVRPGDQRTTQPAQRTPSSALERPEPASPTAMPSPPGNGDARQRPEMAGNVQKNHVETPNNAQQRPKAARPAPQPCPQDDGDAWKRP